MTGVQYGQRSTLGARELDLHINIEDTIEKYPNYRKELIKRWSGKNFKKAVKSHKYEWGVRDNRKLQTTVNVGCANDGTTIVVNDPGVFNVDDVFQDSSKPFRELNIRTKDVFVLNFGSWKKNKGSILLI